MTSFGNLIDRLPHRPPMRLVEEILDVVPGESARASRRAHAGDWYFDGHFPGQPVVPAIVLVELLAQTGGLAASSLHEEDHSTDAECRLAERNSGRPCPGGAERDDIPRTLGAGLQLRVAAFGPFKFPDGAGPGALLVASARVVGRMGGLVKIEGEVTADGVKVASGSVMLAEPK